MARYNEKRISYAVQEKLLDIFCETLSRLKTKKAIKNFIKSTHNFYSSKVPEISTLARRLYEEHDLKSFYRTFNRLWNSGYHNERVLAIYTLKLYKEQ